MSCCKNKLTFKVFVEAGGKSPTRGKQGDAGLDCYAFGSFEVNQGELAKIPLGFRYAFWEDGKVSSNYWLEIKNRSGVGIKSGFTTVAEVCDAGYRGIPHYCVAKVTTGNYIVTYGDKIAQALINPFVDPYLVEIEIVKTIEELGVTERGDGGFGSTGK
jgi:dUTP pyrophosphatase